MTHTIMINFEMQRNSPRGTRRAAPDAVQAQARQLVLKALAHYQTNGRVDTGDEALLAVLLSDAMIDVLRDTKTPAELTCAGCGMVSAWCHCEGSPA